MGITSESLVWLQCGLFMLGAMAFVTNPTLVLSTSIQNTTTPESLPVTDNDVTTMNFNYTTGRYTPNTTFDVPTTSVVSSNPNSTVPVYPNTTDAMTSAILNTKTPTSLNPNTTLPTLPITLNPNTTMPTTTEPISVNPNTTIPTIPVNPNSTLPTLLITLNPNTTISTEPISVNPNITIPTVPITMNPNITISTEPISVNPNTTIPTVPITVNPNTTMPTFPITMNPNTTMSTEPISVNPNTTIPTIPVNPNTTLPTLPISVNPNSTLPTLPITMNPNTTISTEPVSINPNATTTVYVSVSPNATTPSAPNTTQPITVSPNATSKSTSKMRETTTERITSKAPIVPPPEYPEVPGDPEKIIQIQIRTTAPDDCIPSTNDSSLGCNEFKKDFIREVSGAYGDVDGFREVNVTNIRESVYTKHFNDIFTLDVYVDHEVIYDWNQMDPSDRGLSATEIYEMTIEANVEDGSIGNLTVISCPECIIEETTELCKSDTDVTCKEGTYLDPFCINGYPLCQSQCERKDCGSYGICSQESRKPAQCSCQYSKDVLYFGENCKRSVKKLPLFIGVVVAVFLIFVVIAVLSVCLIMKIRTEHSEKDIDEGDETDSSTLETVLGINNYGVVTTYETYDIKNPALELSGTKEDFEHAIANEYLEVFGGDHRHSGIEYETVKVRADQKKEENPYFWGNLESD